MLAAAGMVNRPSIALLAATWAGILGGRVAGGNLAGAALALSALAGGLVLALGPRFRLALLAGAFLVLGVLRSPDSAWNRKDSPADLARARGVPVVLQVKTAWLAASCSDRVTAEVSDVLAGPGALAGRRVVLRGLEDVEPPERSSFKVCGRLTAPRARLNPFGMDPLSDYRRRGCVGAVEVASVAAEPGTGLTGSIARFRRRLQMAIRTAYPGEASGMLEAMLLGQRSNLAPRIETVMLKAGTYHVISVSGLHVGIVVLVLSAFLSVLGLNRVALAALLAVAISFYVVFTGTPPSAVRSGGLFLILGLCRVLQWKVDFANCVAAAGVGLLVAFPQFAWDIGFQLSLGAVLGMALLLPQIDVSGCGAGSVWARARRYLVGGVIVGLAAEAFTLPIVLHDFGRASLVAPIGNLIMVPLTTLSIAGGIEASFALAFSERLASILLKAAAGATDLAIVLADLVTRHPLAMVYVGRPGPGSMAAYCAGLGFLTFLSPGMSRRLKLLLVVGLHGFLLVPWSGSPGRLLRVTYLHVGDGDAALIEVPGGERVLFDAGPNTEAFGQAQNQVVRFLAMKGINRLDRVVVTHAHDDHYGGLGGVLDNFVVRELLVGDLDGEPEYEELLERAQRAGVAVRCVRAGDVIRSGPVVIEVLHPGEPSAASAPVDANQRSVVARVSMGDVAFMFTGDVTPEAERALVLHAAESADGSLDLASVVLKAPHHGAPNSLDPSFLDRVRPRVAVISAGGKFASHPSRSTIDLLRARGAVVYTTSADGAVSVATDGASLEVRTEAGAGLVFSCAGAGAWRQRLR
ncbi:MAG: DNA internalization-related competence protein ComEC/Rec2 [bacterium]